MKNFEDFFIILYYLHKSQGHTKLASKAEWYTLCRFAPQNRLLGEAPYALTLRKTQKLLSDVFSFFNK